MKIKKRLLTIICSALLVVFTLYVMLDTFVITRIYATVETSSDVIASQVDVTGSGYDSSGHNDIDTETGTTSAETQGFEQTTEDNEASVAASETSISVEEYYINDTTVYVADITLSSSDELKTAMAYDSFGKNVTQKTSEIAAANNATLAINGDYYGSRNNGYVVRNGVIYRDTPSGDQEDLVIYSDGSFEIINEAETSLYDLNTDNICQIFSFGPALLEAGEISVSVDEEVGKAMASNPRTAIGIIDDLHYVFVVSDGRTEESEGLSIYELAEFMQTLGVKTAYNLDGGGSSTMYYNGEIINNPTTNGNRIKEREVSDIIYIS